MSVSEKIRVLIVQGYIPHYRISLFDRLAQQEHLEVSVLHSGNPTSSPDLAYNEIVVDEHALGPLRYQDKLVALSKSFDVVVAMFDVRFLSTMQLLLMSKQTRVVLWGIGLGRRKWVNKLRIPILHKAQGLLVYDDRAIKHFVERGVAHNQIFVAPNTMHIDIDVDWEMPRNHFLFVGQFKARKRVQDLIEAFYCARAQLPESANVVIVGSGSQRTELEALVDRLGIRDRVSFLGKITSGEALAPLFAQAIAYVSPGHVGLGVLQSFAHGVPVVTTQDTFHGPEANNIVDGENSLYYDGSIHMLADTLIDLANHPEKALMLGKNAYTHYRQHRTIDNMVDGFLQAIDHAQLH